MKLIFCLALAGCLFACSKQDTPPDPFTQNSILTDIVNVDNLRDALPLDRGEFLLSSETQGLFLQKGKNQYRVKKGQFEALGKVAQAYAVVDSENNRLVIFDSEQQNFKELSSVRVEGFQLNAFCDYVSPNDGGHYVFLLNGDGLVEQHLVNYQGRYLDTPIKIKRFFVGSDVSSCVALTGQQRVYFSEENVGIFSYKAEPESDRERMLVAATQPVGKLSKKITSLVRFDEQTLMGVNEKTNELNRILLTDEGASVGEVVLKQFPDARLETLHQRADGLLAVDPSQGVLYQIPMNTKAPQTALVPRVSSVPIFSVTATVETPPVKDTGDAADDPAIWYNKKMPSESLVLGTNKKQGLLVYDLKGKFVQSIPHGHINNVDVRYGLTLKGKTVDIAASSNRSNNSLSLYTIDPATRKVNLATEVPLTMKDPYGLCMGQKGNQLSVWINDKSGLFEEYLVVVEKNHLTAKKARHFSVGSQPEGCVVDDKTQRLFVGEEDVGVWVVDLAAKQLAPQSVIKVGGVLTADVEGISIAYQGYKKKDVLVISSQGDNSYVLVDTQSPYKVFGKFRIGLNPGKGIDGVSETDGLSVSTKDFGGQFSKGILITQDGYNLMPSAAQNFKYVPWSFVQQGLEGIDGKL